MHLLKNRTFVWAAITAIAVIAVVSLPSLLREVAAAPSLCREEVSDFGEIQRRAEVYVHSIGKPGGEIVLSTFSNPKSFNPITSTETSTSTFTALMYEGLVSRDGVTLLEKPALAERWETSEDGLTWVFFLRPGLEWSDGVPLSAYDVEFTFNDLIYNKDIVPNSARDILMLEGKQIDVRALDSTRVEFVLPFQFAPFLSMAGQEILPKHKFEDAVRQGTFSTELSISVPPSEIVVNGPFMLEAFLSSQKVIFRRNPRYWKKDTEGNALPYLDRLVFMVVSDMNVEKLKFLRGEVDYYAAKGDDYPELKRSEAQAGGSFSVHRLGPQTGANFLVFNQNLAIDSATGRTYVDPVKLGWFRNDNFRRAIAHAVDKENMIKIAMNGLGYPQVSPKTPAEGFFFTDDVRKYPYDLDRAREILAAEGFTDKNGDGFLQDNDGNTLEFSFITNSGNNVRIKLAEIVRRDLQDIGIKVHFQILEFNALIQKLDNPPYSWDCIMLGLTGGPEPHFGRNVWHSSGGLHMWYPRQPKPSTDWEARIDEIFDMGVKEMDRDKRKELYDEWQRIVADKQPFIYTVLNERIECIWNKFGNLNPNMNTGLLHNLEYLYIL